MIYISKGNIPSQSGNGLQVMKMSQAFSKLVPNFELIIPGDIFTLLSLRTFDFWKWYGITHPFKITKLPSNIYCRYPISPNWETHRFLDCAFRYVKWLNPKIAYTRSHVLANLLMRNHHHVILEDHWIPDITPLEIIKERSESEYFVGLITISNFLAKAHFDVGIPQDKIMVLSDGVDLERYENRFTVNEARLKLGLTDYDKVVLFSGHLDESWGINEIILAAKELSDTLFLILGGFNHHIDFWRGLVHEMNLSNTRILGFIPNIDIPLYQYAADIVLMPYKSSCFSVNWMSPLKMFEYMAAGKPIISSDLAPIRAFLQNEENAILIPPDDPKMLARMIVYLFDNPDVRKKIGDKAKEDVIPYTWDNRANKVIDFVNSRLSKR